MARGISLHVGVNRPSASAFPGLAPLAGCENDAVSMCDIAALAGFEPATLLQGPEATLGNVVAKIEEAAVALNAEPDGGTFLFTFAGHGCRVFDVDLNLGEEPDREDEALVLFDLLLLDDYVRRVLWPKFNQRVRVVGIADACHSGTSLMASIGVVVSEHLAVTLSGAGGVTSITEHTVELLSVTDAGRADDLAPPAFTDESAADGGLPALALNFGPREIPPGVASTHLNDEANRPAYESLNIPAERDAPPGVASLLTLAACQDNETTRDGFPHGAFTAALLEVWDGGAFAGTYAEFAARIKERLPNQTPLLTPKGEPDLRTRRPFSIAG